MSKNLYKFVGTRIRAFCDRTYYSEIVFSFEQSYDGKEWTKEIEFATLYNGTDICFENDWNEGQTYIRNLRIWHLEDSEPVVHCKDCKYNYANMVPGGKGCQQNVYIEVDDNFFCANGEREGRWRECLVKKN